MSRFWAAGAAAVSDDDSDDNSDKSSDDSSKSSNDNDDDTSSDDDDNNNNNNDKNAASGENRWLAFSDDEDSSDDDDVRIVKSGKERAFEFFQKQISLLYKAMKVRDYYTIQTLFDDLMKAMIKAKAYLKTGVPRPLVRILVDLENYIHIRLQDKEQFKVISARQSRAVNRMKLTLKKHNVAYKVVMDAYRSNPDTDDMLLADDDDDDDDDDKENDGDDDDSSSSSSSDSDDSDAKKKKKTKTKDAKPVDSDDSDSDSDSDDDDDDDSDVDDADEKADGSVKWDADDSSSSSEDEDAGAYLQLKGRARWLKKNTFKKEKVVKDKEGRSKLRAAEKAAALAAAIKLTDGMTATKSIIPEEGLTPSIIHRRVQELAAQRGRKGRDNRQLLRELEALSRLAIQFGPRIEIPILMYVISAQFGLQRTLDDYMDTLTWKSCANYLERIANVLDDGYVLGVETIDSSDMIATTASKNMKTATLAGATAATTTTAASSATTSAISSMVDNEKLINPNTGEMETIDARAERIRIEKEMNMSDDEKKVIYVVGTLSLHLTRLEEEYTKSLQKISHHSSEYIVRLRDESKLVRLLARFQSYYECRANAVEPYITKNNNGRGNSNSSVKTQYDIDFMTCTDAAAQLAQLRIEHIYYRHDSIAKQVDKAALFYEKFGEASMLHPACVMPATVTTTETVIIDHNSDFSMVHPGSFLGKPVLDEKYQVIADSINFTDLLSTLCKYVYKYATEKAKTRSMICQIYHHALHNRFVEARDLLLMSHLQETIYDKGDVGTMILFNRMMVTVGMCAFRSGRIHDAHQCLSDICSGRVRELLAQGVNTSRFTDKTAEQEKAEKRRLVPYHQHINLDLLEACHLISAMLLEVPNMAGSYGHIDDNGANTRRHRVISRTFRKFHDQYNHQVFTGPPEQTRDFVMRAAKSLMKGDWNKCVELLTNLDVWALVPSSEVSSSSSLTAPVAITAKEQIATMLTQKIKLEGLRTYLFAFAAQYDSLSLSQLCKMFEMSKNEVHSVCSKMMINRDLYASWDQPTETIVLRKMEPSNLQILSLSFAEKTANLVESNERLLDAQSGGGYNNKDDNWKQGGGDDRWSGGRGGGRGGRGGGYRGGDGGGGRYNDNRGGRGGSRGGGRGGDRSGGRGGGRGGRSGDRDRDRVSGGGRGGPSNNRSRGGTSSSGGSRGSNSTSRGGSGGRNMSGGMNTNSSRGGDNSNRRF